jgi:hypothetical protein
MANNKETKHEHPVNSSCNCGGDCRCENKCNCNTAKPERRPTKLMAVGSFVLSFIEPISAVVIGHVALREYRQRESQVYRGFALAGTIIGYVGIAARAAMVMFFTGLMALTIGMGNHARYEHPMPYGNFNGGVMYDGGSVRDYSGNVTFGGPNNIAVPNSGTLIDPNGTVTVTPNTGNIAPAQPVVPKG